MAAHDTLVDNAGDVTLGPAARQSLHRRPASQIKWREAQRHVSVAPSVNVWVWSFVSGDMRVWGFVSEDMRGGFGRSSLLILVIRRGLC
jgi:hypothetical protein